MKITGIKLRKLHGTMEFRGEFWEERLIQPLDIYPEYKVQGPASLPKIDDNHYAMASTFVEIETDGGVTGIGGPIDGAQSYIIATSLSKIIEGKDPTANELLWDQMFRASVHGRQGETMMAISAIDCALWDLRGKIYNAPVVSLLGGPTRTEIPAYASMLGFNVEDPALVRERALEYKSKGYRAQKWFFRHGPMDGPEGFKKNVELVRTLREAVGDDDDIMLDCWLSWNLTYTKQMAEQIEEFHPRWLEETAMPDRIDTYSEIRASTTIPLSGAEHEYTRWGFKRFVEAGALDVIQPDIYWAGGITETVKIATYASIHDLQCIPHGHSSQANAHFSCAMVPTLTPIQEYLVKWNTVHQWFLKDPIIPQNGVIHVSMEPGMGMELDPDKIESEEQVEF